MKSSCFLFACFLAVTTNCNQSGYKPFLFLVIDTEILNEVSTPELHLGQRVGDVFSFLFSFFLPFFDCVKKSFKLPHIGTLHFSWEFELDAEKFR